MRSHLARRLAALLSIGIATCALGLVPVRGSTRTAEVDDLLGSWKLNYTSPDGKARECVITLSRAGAGLRGDYWDGATTRLANDVGIDRGELSFWVDGKHDRRAYKLTYKGRRKGDTLRGAVYWKYGWWSGSFDFTGKRLAKRVAVMPAASGAPLFAHAPVSQLASDAARPLR